MASARAEGLALIVLMLIMSFVFQVQLKIIADDVAPVLARQAPDLGAKMGALVQAVVTWRSLLIMVLAGLLFLIWFMVLTRLDLSLALPLASLGIVINSIGSGVLLQEELTAGRISGVLAVAIGIVLILKS